MLSRSQQALFQPLVRQAWSHQCSMVGRNERDALARDAWYREQIAAATHDRTHSTKDVTRDEFRLLCDRLSMLANAPCQSIFVTGWTDAQNARFVSLAKDAWDKSCSRGDSVRDFETWLDAELAQCGILHRAATGRKESFDHVMAHLAIIAGDAYWIDKTSRASEDRMRWQIHRILREISEVSGTTVGWEYVRGIYTQADLLPADMADAPVGTLWKVFQMLDTHLRRLRKDSASPLQSACSNGDNFPDA
jgi:hypothetical protein